MGMFAAQSLQAQSRGALRQGHRLTILALLVELLRLLVQVVCLPALLPSLGIHGDQQLDLVQLELGISGPPAVLAVSCCLEVEDFPTDLSCRGPVLAALV